MNIHFHMLFLDGVYVTTGERLIFRRVPPPTVVALENLVYVISKRVGGALERQGLLARDFENSFLTVDTPDGAGFDDLLGHSITYRIALGPLAKAAKRVWVSKPKELPLRLLTEPGVNVSAHRAPIDPTRDLPTAPQ